MIIVPALLLVALHTTLAALTPNSCYWCVTTGQTWDSFSEKCNSTGYPVTSAQMCTDNLDLTGVEDIVGVTYDGGENTTFNGSAIVGTFNLPLNN